jgi:hypothetical protein
VSAQIIYLSEWRGLNETIWGYYLNHRSAKVTHEMSLYKTANDLGISVHRVRLGVARKSRSMNYDVQKGQTA